MYEKELKLVYFKSKSHYYVFCLTCIDEEKELKKLIGLNDRIMQNESLFRNWIAELYMHILPVFNINTPNITNAAIKLCSIINKHLRCTEQEDTDVVRRGNWYNCLLGLKYNPIKNEMEIVK